MPHPLSNDLRERVVAFVEAGHSCNEAARHFDTSVSFAVNLMALLRETGSVEPRPIGGKRHGKLDPAEAFLLAFIERAPDVTMPELAAMLLAEKGIMVAPQSLSRWLIKKGFSYKNVWPAPLQVICREHHDQFASTYPASGLSPGQDGDTRVPVLIKLPASSAVF